MRANMNLKNKENWKDQEKRKAISEKKRQEDKKK